MKQKKFWNDLKANRLYHRRRNVLASHPTVYTIETTNHCNLDCIMCPRSKMTRKKGFMDVSLFEKIIEQGRDYASIVWLHLFGEPLLHPDLIQMIEFCHANGLRTGLSTNCTVLTEDISEKLLKSGLDEIILSLDGATEETYNKLRRKGNYEQSVGNALRFLDIKARGAYKRPIVTVQAIRMKETVDELAEYRKKWREHKVYIKIKRLNTWPVELERMDTECRLAEPKRIVYPCKWLWRYAVIFWDGTVVPCFSDFDGEFVLGNVNEQSLDEIWNGKAAVKLRQQHVDLAFPKYCRDCDEPVGERANPLYPLDWRPLATKGGNLINRMRRIHSNT